MNVDHAREQLLEVKATLDSLGIPFWLREGTLLAAVRDRGFFPWDHDIDLSIRASDWHPSLYDEFAGFTCTPMKYALGRVTSVHLSKTNDLRVSLIFRFYHPEEDVYVTLSPPYGDCLRTVIPARYLDELNQIEFLGTTFRIPRNPEEVLENIYGDWRTPVKSGVSWREGWGKIEMGKYLKGVV